MPVTNHNLDKIETVFIQRECTSFPPNPSIALHFSMKPHLVASMALTLLFAPLCTSADENIKVDALKQNNPNLASIPNLVCLLLFLLLIAYKLRKRMLTATTTFPQLTRRSQSGSVVTSLEQFSCNPDTPRHVEAKKKLDKSMAIGWGNWNAQHPRHRLLDALYGYRRYHERQKAEVDRFEGLYKHVSRAQKSVSLPCSRVFSQL